jgi:hypothetical protein
MPPDPSSGERLVLECESVSSCPFADFAQSLGDHCIFDNISSTIESRDRFSKGRDSLKSLYARTGPYLSGSDWGTLALR